MIMISGIFIDKRRHIFIKKIAILFKKATKMTI